MHTSLREEIGKHCQAMKTRLEGINRMNAALGPVGVGGDVDNKSVKQVSDGSSKIATALIGDNLSNDEKKLENAIAIAKKYSRERPPVGQIFEGVQTRLCKEMKVNFPKNEHGSNHVTSGLVQLEEIVSRLKGELKNQFSEAGRGKYFTGDQKKALNSIVAKAEATIQTHQEKGYADSSTLLQAKNEVIRDLKRFETSVAIRSQFASAGERLEQVKKSFQTAMFRVGLAKVPPVMQSAVANRAAALSILAREAKGQVSQANKVEVEVPKGPKR